MSGDDKRALRALIGERLAAVTGDERRAWSRAITGRVLASGEYARAGSVFCYVGRRGEPDTLPLIERMLGEGKRVYLPMPRERGIMDAVRLLSAAELRPGRYGILEPLPDGEIAPPEALELILVPGAAFDRALFRLGWGAGYYDRYLTRARAPALGVAFNCQRVIDVPREAHDRPVDKLVTERATYGREPE